MKPATLLDLRGPALLCLVLAMAPGPASAGAQDIAAAVCAACHGADGNGLAPTFPKLAGQQAGYLSRQLADFKSGKRRSEIMAPNAASLSPEDMKALGLYFAALKPTPGQAEDKALAVAGEKLYMDGNADTAVAACFSCHKDKGLGDSRYPRVAGQNQAYVIQQLSDFKSGARTNDKLGVMQAVARRLSEPEMKAVAEYLAGQ